MPPDPFADDPNDPALFLAEGEMDERVPLSQEDYAGILYDLALVTRLRAALVPHGIRGVFFFCEDCYEDHFFDWDMMESNLKATLADQQTPVHEPSASVDPADYVAWDYAVGYMDALEGRGPRGGERG